MTWRAGEVPIALYRLPDLCYCFRPVNHIQTRDQTRYYASEEVAWHRIRSS